MIVAEQKSVEEILKNLSSMKSVVVAGCGTCVTVCLSGGEKEAQKLAALLEVEAKERSRELNVMTVTPKRQCDMEFLNDREEELDAAECILSLACGAGVQFLAEKFPNKVVLPGLNTKFLGVNRDSGYWTEMCQGCGNCILDKTGGVCPVARCSKSNFNGPCGGSAGGRCEISSSVACAWQLIYERAKRLGRVEMLEDVIPPKDWRSSRDGGPRSIKKVDILLEEIV